MQCQAPTPPSRPSSTTGAVAEDSGEVEEEAEEEMVEVKIEEEEEVTEEEIQEIQVRVRAKGSTPGTRRPDTLTSLHLNPVSGTGPMGSLHTFVWSPELVLGRTFGHRNLQLKIED